MLENAASWTEHVSARDGTLLAAHIFVPDDHEVTQPRSIEALPVVWMYDRYHQVQSQGSRHDFARGRWPEASIQPRDVLDLSGAPTGPSLANFPWAITLRRAGYALAVVDGRGTGLSQGFGGGPFSEQQATDCYDITEWLAEQPWCDGNVGMAGRSYLGIMQFLAAAKKPPHLRAIFPQMALFDLYSFAYDGGGVFREDFARSWTAEVRELDAEGRAKRSLSGSRGGEQAGSIAGGKDPKEPSAAEMLASCPRRSDLFNGEQIYQTRSPSSYLQEINSAGIPVYQIAGWHDIWVKDALLWHENLEVDRQLTIGPWAHTEGLMGGDGLHLGEEHVAWFDRWMRGPAREQLGERRPDRHIRYFTGDGRGSGSWSSTEVWPPPDVCRATMGLSVVSQSLDPCDTDGRVGADHEFLDYTLDYRCTSGTTTRWTSGYGGPFEYKDLAKNDALAVNFTSSPTLRDLEITGAPVVKVVISAEDDDLQLFAYFEVVDPEGYARYLTEGCVDAGSVTAVAEFRQGGAKYHVGRNREPRAIKRKALQLDLHPISTNIPAGSRLRISLTGADRDNARTSERSPAPTVRFHAGGTVDLPVVGGAQTLANALSPTGAYAYAVSLAAQQTAASNPESPFAPAPIVSAFEIDGGIDSELLSEQIRLLGDRHPVLRTLLCGTTSDAAAVVLPVGTQLDNVENVTVTEGRDWKEHETVQRLIAGRWELAANVPWRAAILHINATTSAVVMIVHSGAADAESTRIILSELVEVMLGGSLESERTESEPLAVGAAEQARERSADRVLKALQGAPQRLSLGRMSTSVRSFAPTRILWRSVDVETFDRIDSVARKFGMTRPSVLLAALGLTMRAWTGDEDLVLSLTVNRRMDGEEGLVGPWAELVPVRLRIPSTSNVTMLLDATRSAMGVALDPGSADLRSVVEAADLEYRGGEVGFSYCESVPSSFQLPGGAELRRVRLESGYSASVLSFTVHKSADECWFSLELNSATFSGFTADALMSAFVESLRWLIEECEDGTGIVDCSAVAGSRALARRLRPKGARIVAEDWGDNSLLAPLHDYCDLKESDVDRVGLTLSEGWSVDVVRGSAPVPIGAIGRLRVSRASDEDRRYLSAYGRWVAFDTLQVVGEPESYLPFPSVKEESENPSVQHLPHADVSVSDVVANGWRDLLVITPSEDDDWFSEGGDSLKMVRLLARIRRTFPGMQIGLNDLFSTPTLKGQTALIQERLGDLATRAKKS